MIALVREHAEKIRAPRALWVPFELGRPLGSPIEPEFQRRVIAAALALLDSDAGPVVLEDFPEDAPGPKAEEQTNWVCPVSFPPPATTDAGKTAALLGEIDTLTPWYQLSLDRRGRTLVGASEFEIPAAARFVASFLNGAPDENPVPGKPLAETFKDVCSDIVAFYSEAGTAQPGSRSSIDVQNWFWRDTAAGEILLEVRAALRSGEDADLRFVADRVLLPKTQSG